MIVFLLNKRIRPLYRIFLVSVIVLALFVSGGTLARRLVKTVRQTGELFSTSDVPGTLDNITKGRVDMLRNWSDALVRFPLAGIGAGNFLFYFRYQNFKHPVYEDLPLNQYLHVAVETGLIGLLAFAFFLACFWRAQRRPAERITVTAILIILFVNTALWLPECILLFFLLAAGASGDPPFRPARFRLRLLVLPVLLAFILANAAAFSALHPLNWATKCRTGYDYGLYPLEKELQGVFRWSGAEFGFYLYKGEAEAVTIHCAAPLSRLPGNSQTVRLYWNGVAFASKRFTRNDDLDIPIKGRAGFLEFRVTPDFSPRALRLSADSRQLGVQVYVAPGSRP
jgi:hypothetical protein